MFKFTFAQLTTEETNKLKSKLQLLPPMPMEEFEKELEQIDTNYPFSVPGGLQLSIQIIVGLVLLVTVMIRIWLCSKHKSQMQGLWSLTSKVPDLLRQDLSPITKLFDHSNLQPIDIKTPIFPPIIVPTTSRPIPAPHPIQTNKPHPLTISLPSTTNLPTDDFELTSLGNETRTQTKVTDASNKGNLLLIMFKKLLYNCINRTKYPSEDMQNI